MEAVIQVPVQEGKKQIASRISISKSTCNLYMYSAYAKFRSEQPTQSELAHMPTDFHCPLIASSYAIAHSICKVQIRTTHATHNRQSSDRNNPLNLNFAHGYTCTCTVYRRTCTCTCTSLKNTAGAALT